MTDVAQSLYDFLQEVNGQDAYSTETVALGRLRREEYLALPRGVHFDVIDVRTVGSGEVGCRFDLETVYQIYALNKARAPEGEDAIKYALVRLEAVKMGWFSRQREVEFVDEIPEAEAVFIADQMQIRQYAYEAQRTAWLIPLAAEHTFRTFGHHYLTGAAADYERRYRQTLTSCLAPEVASFMRPSTLYHHCLHWVSPARARAVLEAQVGGTRIPEAIALRVNAAPAGTALVTTTAAVLSAMQSSGIRAELDSVGVYDLSTIEAAANAVKEAPTRFHKLHHAFGVDAPPAEMIALLDNAKAIAMQFAPIAQAFINTMFRDTALSGARALQKHAAENPVMLRRAERLFRTGLRMEATRVRDLFNPIVAE